MEVDIIEGELMTDIAYFEGTGRLRRLEREHFVIVVSAVVDGDPSEVKVSECPLITDLLSMDEQSLGCWFRRLVLKLLDSSVVQPVTPFESLEQLVAVQIYRGGNGQDISVGEDLRECDGEHVSALFPVGRVFGDYEAQVGVAVVDMITRFEGIIYTARY
jgi:hypothetical protein